MKIVLVEDLNGQVQNERTFEQATVKIGRDPSECQIVFEQARWPMVSRRHAEIRWREGRWLLVDTNSSFGTFLNGRRITEPSELQQGSKIQFGTGGPQIILIVLDTSAPKAVPSNQADLQTYKDQQLKQGAQQPTSTPLSSQPLGQPPQQQPGQRVSSPPSQHPSFTNKPGQMAQTQTANVELINTSTGQLRRIPVNKPVITIGRDPSNDIALDASSAVVSRRHAEIRNQGGQFFVHDLGSFNGTLVNEQRITSPTPLYDGDRVQLGRGGPTLRFSAPGMPAPAGASITGQRVISSGNISIPPQPAKEVAGARPGMHTMVIKGGVPGLQQQMPEPSSGQLQFLMRLSFDGKQQLSIGRAPTNDIHLDGLQISKNHARLVQSVGAIFIEDAGSTNGVYVNGKRITARQMLTPRDVAQIGPFVIRCEDQGVMVFDTRSKTRIDAVDITKVVKNRSGGGMIKLLDDVDISIQPNEFVGLLGPSGAGKSTLMDALNGMRPASSGKVLINDLDLYQHLDSLKQSIGYVPQDDIIHRELTVYRTLYYVAKLRLSRDVTSDEIDQIINEVMDVTGLSERRDVPVSQLSGGQRKRVSIAVELITKPSIIFLDEPTSGLDPATEEKIMKLFRQIAESGRTIVLTTHAMENVKLFDKIVVLMRGKLVFYGTPQEALQHVKAESFKDLYDKLENPIEEKIAKLGQLSPNAPVYEQMQFKRQRETIAEEVAESWKQKFEKTEQYRRNIVEPLSGLERHAQVTAPTKQRQTLFGAIRQWVTLSRRYAEVLRRDKFNLFILFAQAPIVGLMTFLVTGVKQSRDFPYFILAIVAIWFGTSIAAREIIRERAVYNRERMVNLGLFPYVWSKLFNLSFIVGLQCILLFGTMKFFDLLTSFVPLIGFPMPGYVFGIPQLIVMIVTGMVGVALGLFISACVKTSEMATSLVPLILIPQILFAGLVGVPERASKVIGLVMPATWSFDEMKRLSGLDTLREEGSSDEKGLYKKVEDENDRNVKDTREKIKKELGDAKDELNRYERNMKEYIDKLRQGQDPGAIPAKPTVGEGPKVSDAVKVPEDLSKYVDFLHPWMHGLVNPIVLLFMFFGLVLATVIALRLQDT
jgi:ABC-type multidrug transport system ATPase subunit/pSer/pThr/pTyr-binding forkhead associated (FHA) protein